MEVITTKLMNIFKDLDSDKFKPLGMRSYIEEVLMPEVSFRLISEDMNISLDEAKLVRENSVEFGMYVHSHKESLYE
jgi:RTC4-like domain